MRANRIPGKVAIAFAIAVFAVTLWSVAGFAANDLIGTWKVEDTKGEPFEITLSEDGNATGNRAGEGLTGKWKDEDGSAVIDWDSGWTTEIAKDGSKYVKKAFEKGKRAAGTPTHSSAAEKIQ